MPTTTELLQTVTENRLVDSLSSAVRTCVCGRSELDDYGPCRLPSTFGLTEQEAHLSSQVSPGHLYRCRRCHLGLRLPRPDQFVLDQLYTDMSSDRWSEQTPLSAAQQFVLGQLASSNTNAPIRVLDIGAFDGRFLSAIPERSQRFAIEPSSGGQEKLAGKGIEVIKPFLTEPTQSEFEQFDLVTMFDVFEHLPDPIQGTKCSLSYVKPGGRLVIGTSNLDHWSWSATAGYHWYMDPIQHVSVGSSRHFRWLQKELPQTKLKLTSLPHQFGSIKTRLWDTAQMLYFGVRRRRIARPCIRLMHLHPALRALAHKDAVPYTQTLHDHVVAEFAKVGDP